MSGSAQVAGQKALPSAKRGILQPAASSFNFVIRNGQLLCNLQRKEGC